MGVTPPAPDAAPTLPVYLMFVTDGEASDRRQAEREIIKASYHPLFWQFMAVGGSRGGFPFLSGLDEMEGRFIDNANFFHVVDPSKIPDNELYDLLMGEYPDWIKKAQKVNLLK